MTHLSFDAMPSMGQASLSALLSRKSSGRVSALPALSAEVSKVRFEPDLLKRFRRLCAVTERGTLPVTSPHVLVAPLHMKMLSHKAFPLPLLGLVHIDNTIVQHRAIAEDAELDIHCELGELSEHDKGQRFEILTRVSERGELVWEETTGVLKRAPSGEKMRLPRPPAPPGEEPSALRSVLWRVGSDAGRRYAGVSGDYNPIHLTAASAKLFGFKRAIVHGMWSLARCVAELDVEFAALKGGACTLDVAFKTPVFLPGQVAFCAYPEEGGVRFALRSADGVKPHLAGHLAPL